MTSAAYEARKKRQGARQLKMSVQGREIGPPPDVASLDRKRAGRNSFRLFCEHYFPQTFSLAWSDDHLKVIAQIEESVLHGGLFATAMPRGSGKTSLAEVACTWACLYGHRDFVALIGSDEGHASQMLDSIKTDLESNDLLLEDFPEAIYPIRRLEGISHRCHGQICEGKRTQIGWTADEIVLPTIPGSRASGAIIKVAGITGGLRGMKFKRPDGKTVRPSLVIVDDPQTDASARSPSQCESRERLLAGAILGLAGPGKKISGIMPCTVIRPGDMADRILDRKLHPDWNGTRTKMVYSFPIAEKLWEEYGRIRADSLRAQHGGREATEFYAKNRAEMDAGARVAWEARHDPDEVSALQHAMNLKLRDERAFHAEYQNDPLPEEEPHSDDLTSDQIAAKLSQRARGEVAVSCSRLTAFIDIQASLLYYVVCAWEDGFNGYVIDYGTFPDQKTAYFTLQNKKLPLSSVVKGAGLEGQIRGGLERLTDALIGRPWLRDDGAELRIERCLIDANWGVSTETILKFCRESSHAGVLMPSHGKYFGAASKPISEWDKKQGDRTGSGWKIPVVRGKGMVRRVIFDTNYWKSFVHNRLGVAMGDRGCLSLFGDSAQLHRMFADHLTAEYRVRTEGRGRKCDEWRMRSGTTENHWLDCLVGCCVAASIQGVSLAETEQVKAKSEGSRKSFAAAYAEKWGNARA